MHIKQAALDIGLNTFAIDLVCESLLRAKWVESMHERGEPFRVPWPVNRSDLPGWAGVEVTLRPLKAGDKIAPAVRVSSTAIADIEYMSWLP